MRIILVFLFMSLSLHAAPRFDFILKEIIKFQEFRQEFHETFKLKLKLKEYEKNGLILSANDAIKLSKSVDNTVAAGEKFIDTLYEKAQNISHDSSKAVSLLEFLLEERFDLLFETAKNAESLSNSPIYIPIQDSSLCEQYYGDKDKSEFNQYVKENNIYFYQFKVLLIKKIFQSLQINEFSKNAIKLLRASVQLVDLLTNKTQELGFADNCGGYLKCMIYSNDFKMSSKHAAVAIRNGVKSKTWEKNKKLYDIYWYETHFIAKERINLFKGLGVPKGHGIKYYTTDYEEGLEKDDLPFPDYLKEPIERPFVESESFFATVKFEDFEDDIDILQESNLPIEEQHAEVAVTNDALKDSEKQDKEDFLYPAGVRKFHDLTPYSPYEKLNLKNKQQNLIDKIFDSKAFSTVSYGEFKKLWKSLGGTIIGDRKTAHKQLIGPNKEPLFGVSAHGDSRTYGKNTIKYFRAALYYIGARPSI